MSRIIKDYISASKAFFYSSKVQLHMLATKIIFSIFNSVDLQIVV